MQKTKKVTLGDGSTVCVNDHVYLTPKNAGEQYRIGRVMEFCASHKHQGQGVRIAWYIRFKDINNRKSLDHRLLVATMHSDINPVTDIQGKCTVLHQHYIQDIASYKRQENHYHYRQMYNRDLDRFYDLVLCDTIQQIPLDILQALKESYQFVAVTRETAARLVPTKGKSCNVYNRVSSSAAVSVPCVACANSCHLTCLNTPSARKPSKGYTWKCVLCSRKVLPSAESCSASSSSCGGFCSSSSSESLSDLQRPRSLRATPSRVKQFQKRGASVISQNVSSVDIASNKKDAQAAPPPMRMLNMWPFRYFDDKTTASDILDVNDNIFPRANPLIGAQYQAQVPDFIPSPQHVRHSGSTPSLTPLVTEESIDSALIASEVLSPFSSHEQSEMRHSSAMQDNAILEREAREDLEAILQSQAPSKDHNYQESMAAQILLSMSNNADDKRVFPARGTDETVSVIYRPGRLEEVAVDEYMDRVKQLDNIPLASHNSDLLDRALQELEASNYDTETAYENMAKLNGDDFKNSVDWTPTEIEEFEQSIRKHGHDLNYVKASVRTKGMADIVRYFYQWKKTDRYKQVYSEWTKVHKPRKRFQDEDGEDLESENDPTIVPASVCTTKPYQCSNCLTKHSSIWRRSASNFNEKKRAFSNVLCDECGIYWLKHAENKPTSSGTRSANSAARPSTSGDINTSTNTATYSGGSKRKERDSPVIDNARKRQRRYSDIPLYALPAPIPSQPATVIIEAPTTLLSRDSSGGSSLRAARSPLISVPSSSTASSPKASQSCSQCPAKYSPIWWKVSSSPYSRLRQCQRCHHKSK
ncbi:uncharacterized protein ATC70_000914 [Mucor velutinosus]|uniref:Uncharacterized protein n=1 Tax=Mucor velutinosus TaxID=708070 RepID=A0AAN7DJ16_9FUNG|nr:hypothetical protein ATC70_000914 [Mucor velutinosus]